MWKGENSLFQQRFSRWILFTKVVFSFGATGAVFYQYGVRIFHVETPSSLGVLA